MLSPRTTAVLAMLLASTDYALSLMHALEAAPRLQTWSLELWREATVFNGEYFIFGAVGAPIEIGTILLTAWLAWSLYPSSDFRWAIAGSALFFLALLAWFSLVLPENTVLATWTPGPLPADASTTRLRWETGHLVGAAIKLVALIFVARAAASGLMSSQTH